MRATAPMIALLLLTATATRAFDRSYTVGLEAAEDLQIVAGDIKLNNLALSEKPALFKKDLHNFEVTLSVRNRGEVARNLTVMVAGMGGGKGGLLWAVSAAPPFFTVAPGTTATVKGEAYVSEGTLARTAKIWLRVVGNFEDSSSDAGAGD